MTDIDAKKMLELENQGLVEVVDRVFVLSSYGAQVLRPMVETEVFEGKEIDDETFNALCSNAGLGVV